MIIIIMNKHLSTEKVQPSKMRSMGGIVLTFTKTVGNNYNWSLYQRAHAKKNAKARREVRT